MRSTLSLLILAVLISCGESENRYGSLSENERRNLQEQGLAKCLENNRQDFNTFKSESAENFTDLERGDYYLHEVKNGSTVLRSVKIQVWKVAPPNLYFIYTTTTAEDSTPVYQFVKISSGINVEMVDHVATQRCKSGINDVTASSNSSSITYTKVTTVPIEGEKKTVTTKTNTVSYQFLALFGNYTYTQKVETLTLEDETTDTATVSTSGTLTAQTPIDLAFATYTGYAGATFCVPFVAGTPNVYAFPFVLNCSSGATPSFDPTELAL